MAINALDKLLHGDQSGTAARRSTTSSTAKGFSTLLDAQTARARSQPASLHPAELQGRDNKPTLKTVARVERKDDGEAAKAQTARRKDDDRPARADAPNARDDRARDVRRNDDRPAAADRPKREDAAKPQSDDGADTANAADAANAPRKDQKAPKAEGSKNGAAKAAAADTAAPAPKPQAAAEVTAEAGDAMPAAAVEESADTVPLAAAPVPVALPVAVPVAVVAVAVQPVVETPVEGTAELPEEEAVVKDAAAASDNAAQPAAKPAAEAKDQKVAAKAADQQIALPTSTLAADAKPAPTTEEFADFMLRSAAGAHAAAAGEAAKDAAKADAETPHVSVTVAQPVGSAPVAAPVAPVTAFAAQAVVSNDNAAIEAVKAAGAKAAAPIEGDEAKPVAKDPVATSAGFAQALDAARSADAPDAPRPAARAPIVPPHEQVAVNIRKAVSEGLDQISIRLNPVELGRIDVKLDVSSDGTLRATFAAEKHQTLELLKNDSRQLESSLTQAGFKADAGGLNFSLRGDNGGNAQAFRDFGGQGQNRQGGREDGSEQSAAPAPAAYPRRRAANGRVDLNA